jgi:hypothetical protein
MTDDQTTTDEGGLSAWVIAAVIIAAIVLLVLFVRGPEGEGRSAALYQVAAALIAT